jgi:adenylate cyclase
MAGQPALVQEGETMSHETAGTAVKSPRQLRVGFRTSIITLFVAIVLLVGLTLVYLSFARITAMTQTAATTFIAKVAQLGADRIDARFKEVRDSLEILAGLPAVQSAELRDNTVLYSLMASMLRNNPQLFNLYVGYEDGSFLEMDVIDRANATFRTGLGAPEDAAYRLFLISRTDSSQPPLVIFLSENLIPLAEVPGPTDYDPRRRPWYRDAFKDDGNVLTGPYVFFATGQPGYTLRLPLHEGRRGVVAGDILLNEAESMLIRQRLGKSGRAFLFNDDDRIIAHPHMADLMSARPAGNGELPPVADVSLPGLTQAIGAWRGGGAAQQFFDDHEGRTYLAAFEKIQTAGNANIRLAVVAPLDEFFSEIISERRRLFIVAMLFVAAMVPLVLWIGAILARSLRNLARETDSIQRFELADHPPVHSAIREIDDLGHSVSTMRTVVRTFSSFIPKRLVQQLVASGTAIELGGTRREITALFTDVADFTAKTEKADPTDVMVYTSRYFAAMSETIMAHQGTVDKFIGDAVMAIWNAPVDDPNHVLNACAAVLACTRRNAALNKQFEKENWPPYFTRYGLHVGDAVAGNIGSADRMNYTVLGATVNLAARLEGLNKNYGTSILVSEALKARAEPAFVFRSVDCIKPKGFAEAFTIYELRCERSATSEPETAFDREWEDVFAAIQSASPTGPAMLASFQQKYPDDGVARYHASQLREIVRVASA